MLCVRTGLAYICNAVPDHTDNEYISVTVKEGSCTFTVIAAYLDPKKVLDEQLLENILQTSPPPFVLTDAFNAHHPVWGSSYINGRGRSLVRLSNFHNLCLLNDGSSTYLRNARCSTCLDLTFVSRSLFTKANWFVDGDTRGSDHILTYTSISTFHNRLRRGSVHSTNLTSFRDSMEFTCDTLDSLEDLKTAIVAESESATTSCILPGRRDSTDIEYKRLCAIRRRAERRTRKTKDLAVWSTVRRLQNHVRRRLEKLGRRR